MKKSTKANKGQAMEIGQRLIQGDVILVKVGELPASAVQQEFTKKVLQMSEVTGHHHHFHPTASVDLFIDSQFVPSEKSVTPNLGKLVLVRDEDALLYHGKGFDAIPVARGTGDHEALRVPPGVYRIDIVRVYDYLKNEMSRVVD